MSQSEQYPTRWRDMFVNKTPTTIDGMGKWVDGEYVILSCSVCKIAYNSVEEAYHCCSHEKRKLMIPQEGDVVQ